MTRICMKKVMQDTLSRLCLLQKLGKTIAFYLIVFVDSTGPKKQKHQ